LAFPVVQTAEQSEQNWFHALFSEQVFGRFLKVTDAPRHNVMGVI
jgi:hypothetical protein